MTTTEAERLEVALGVAERWKGRAEIAEGNVERFRKRIDALTDERAALTSKADRLENLADELRGQVYAWQTRCAEDRMEHEQLETALRERAETAEETAERFRRRLIHQRQWSRLWHRAAWEFWRERNFLLGGLLGRDRSHLHSLREWLKERGRDA